MDLEAITNFIEPVSLIVCLCVGYVIKNTKAFEKVANDYIPLIELILGIVLVSANDAMGGIALGVSTIARGAMTGIASVGLHQLFTRTIQGLSGETTEQN